MRVYRTDEKNLNQAIVAQVRQMDRDGCRCIDMLRFLVQQNVDPREYFLAIFKTECGLKAIDFWHPEGAGYYDDEAINRQLEDVMQYSRRTTPSPENS